ncbi:MAG TPA: acyl-CoA dehydratase activase-related protein, partial [Polyangiaceae bacterium]|nr:acyl-CoA dehydratase activase-related protein [Polyangiaceae bacterium]
RAWTHRTLAQHDKEPGRALLAEIAELGWDDVSGACVTGRMGRLVDLPRIPTKQAVATGFRHLFGAEPATIVTIGGHGFSVLELRSSGADVYRENSRCSQGTGNFLRQLVARFDLEIEQASALCEDVRDPAPLSGRCPVILKTDMTHLANKGEGKDRILAGLYDAVCENVQCLIKPGISPSRVLLAGGVSRSKRVRERFREFLARHEMTLIEVEGDDALYLDALGCALLAQDRTVRVPPAAKLLAPVEEATLDRVAGLASVLSRVRRLAAGAAPDPAVERELVLGFDIGSTGSKAVAVDRATRETIWEGYIKTNGDPVGAAQTLTRQFQVSSAARHPVLAFGATGSGREITGSLLSSCFGGDRVFVLNEIAAHAEGALFFDPSVDTIFEIGGQDAKYIRLSEGRVVDAAMNEACSAGTGSFIEEQGRKFSGIESIADLGKEAIGAPEGVSLGQHCSVFMAEIIDEAVASGVDNRSVIAGIYDSIVQNYVNRVKGCRSVGQVVFCQGMPFAADALAAAVARETGSQVVVPPNPGTVGALGIALLAIKNVALEGLSPLDPARFLEAKITRREDFVCKSQKGCGEPGNHCRVDRIRTVVGGRQSVFTWGGSCSLWDKGTGKKKLTDLAPDPFREREALVERIVARVTVRRGKPTIALTDEFQLKDLFPFYATFLYELGFDVAYEKSSSHKTLKRGIERANVPFCAPMQLYHGLIGQMVEKEPDYVFAPMLRDMPRTTGKESHAVACPIVQASPDILRMDLGARGRRILSPVIDFGADDFDSPEIEASCRQLAESLGVVGNAWWRPYRVAREAQDVFRESCLDIGRNALAYAEEHGILAVLVQGRPYTIYNAVLNSNVPALLREQGAIGVPIDCFPVGEDVPTFEGIYWGHGQRNARAAHEVRRTPGIYSIWCSNYSCGPDSFNLHFFSYAMAGKPFAVVETDGHSGDAGTKTRVEAFLHCVREDLASRAPARPASDLSDVVRDEHGLDEIRLRGEKVLFPRMGDGAETVAACLRGIGIRAECLPIPSRDTLRLGRRHTSGKECIPMTITLGSLLERLDRAGEAERFAFFMPTANGPCRFGVYNVLHRIVLERLGKTERVRLWSPSDSDYFAGLPSGFSALVMTGFAAFDALQAALFDVRPVERRRGEADALYRKYLAALLSRLEAAGGADLSAATTLLSIATGRLFGCAELLRDAARDFAALKTDREVPTVSMVGEIYVRLDPFANDFVIDKLERRGIRVRFAPFTEWLEYTDHMAAMRGEKKNWFGGKLETIVQQRILSRTYAIVAKELGWRPRTTVRDSLDAARPYVRDELAGEAVLTLGGPVHEHAQGLIDGVVSVGPHECMPNKIAESQYFHVAERQGLASLTIPINGDAVDPGLLDSFAFEVRSRFEKRTNQAAPEATPVKAPSPAAAAHAHAPAPARVRLRVVQ